MDISYINQAGAFTPFFRGHAHHDTKRREPWVFGEPYTSILRSTAIMRYTLLPYWYSVFHEAYLEGLPVMRTMFTEFPDDANTFTMEDQWMVGNALLVKPVTDAGKTTADVYLPMEGHQIWYDFHRMTRILTDTAWVTVSAPLEKIPVFIRGGKIIPRKLRLRRSSKLMFYDPYTLLIAYDGDMNAVGSLYMDDEYSTEHSSDASSWALREFVMSGGSKITCRQKNPLDATAKRYQAPNTLERVIIAGQPRAPASIVVRVDGNEHELHFFYDQSTKILSIKKPDVLLSDDWDIVFSY